MKHKHNNYGDNWSTPKDFYDRLNSFFNFDFDPCPLNWTLEEYGWNGLLTEWKHSNYVNPPYTRLLKESFVKKGVQENLKGNSSVFLLPVSTSTKLFHDVILPNASYIYFIVGRLGFEGINTKNQWVNPYKGLNRPNHIDNKEKVNQNGQHDSMLVIFDDYGRYKEILESETFKQNSLIFKYIKVSSFK